MKYIYGSTLEEEIVQIEEEVTAIKNDITPEDLITLEEYQSYLAKLMVEQERRERALLVKKSMISQGTGCMFIFRCPKCEQALYKKTDCCPQCRQNIRWK